MNPTSPGITAMACLVWLLAAAPPSTPQGAVREDLAAELRKAREDHGTACLGLAGSACEMQLFNDAQRLALEAQVLWPEVPGAGELLSAIRERRVKTAQEPGRAPYRAFLESDSFARSCAHLSREEQALRERWLKRYLDLAEEALRAEQVEALEGALRRAWALDPSDRRLAALARKPLAQPLAAAIARERSLASMVLGEELTKRGITLEDLAGKVVLWRSFSL